MKIGKFLAFRIALLATKVLQNSMISTLFRDLLTQKKVFLQNCVEDCFSPHMSWLLTNELYLKTCALQIKFVPRDWKNLHIGYSTWSPRLVSITLRVLTNKDFELELGGRMEKASHLFNTQLMIQYENFCNNAHSRLNDK